MHAIKVLVPYDDNRTIVKLLVGLTAAGLLNGECTWEELEFHVALYVKTSEPIWIEEAFSKFYTQRIDHLPK